STGDAGDWTRIGHNGAVSGWNTNGNYGRIVLGLAPSNENILYVLYDNNFSSDCGGVQGVEADLFVYDASIPSWTDLTANLPDETGCLGGNDPFSIQGGYDLVVAVKPNDPNTVFVGGTNVYRSTSGFANTSATTRIGGYAAANTYALYNNHHPDIHVLTFPPNDPNTLYSGSDGGIHSANIINAAVTWTDHNTDYVTYQYYHVALDQTLGSNFVIGGTQDNGTKVSFGGTTHSAYTGGDGVAVGLGNSGARFWGFQNGPIYRNFSPIRPTGTNSSLFVTYFLLDPDNREYLYYADGTDIYRTTNASGVTSSTWSAMTGFNNTNGGTIQSMATSRGAGYNSADNNRVLYVGTWSGEVFR
ncbi:MAG: hypothetical protein AAFP02_23555, partial [Bacteroidota bacterium]